MDIAISKSPEDAGTESDHFDIVFADQLTYDSNLYRLPSNDDVVEVVGLNASREDHINTASLGIESQWTVGRQIMVLNLRGDDSRFSQNTDLNNASGVGKLVWNWSLGNRFSGQVGTDYNRSLLGFANTNIYTKDLQDRTEYFGAGRYQLGPHWAVFGGVLEAHTSYSAVAAKVNDFDGKSGSVGIEYATDINNTFGLEYRYTSAQYTYVNESLNPDYREDTTRAVIEYALTDKAQISASAGYLRRNYSYPGAAIEGFSGDVWRVSLQWQATDKTQFVFAGWRNLQAYVTAGADYFVSTGGSLSPVWVYTEKLSLSAVLSFDHQDYIGTNSAAGSQASRHDKITAQQANITYTPTRALSFNVSYRYERRDSNLIQFEYDDNLASASVTFRF